MKTLVGKCTLNLLLMCWRHENNQYERELIHSFIHHKCAARSVSLYARYGVCRGKQTDKDFDLKNLFSVSGRSLSIVLQG